MGHDKYFIFRQSDGERVAAEVRLTTPEDMLLWARDWAPLLPVHVHFEDAHWDWPGLFDLAEAVPEQFARYSLVADNRLQGLWLLEVSEDEVDRYGTHAHRLSTAPWNRPPQREFRGVGSVLVAAGLLRSVADGHDGCLHLSSLQAAQAFHERNGMVRIGLDDAGLRRYRFTADGARGYIARLRNSGYLVPSWT